MCIIGILQEQLDAAVNRAQKAEDSLKKLKASNTQVINTWVQVGK